LRGIHSLNIYVTVPTQSDNLLRVDAKLPSFVPEYVEPCGLEEENTVDVRITILEGLENSTTRHRSKLLTSKSHESIKFYTNVHPPILKGTTLSIVCEGNPQSPGSLNSSVFWVEEDSVFSS